MTSLLRVGAIAACFSLIPICAFAQSSESDRQGPKPHGKLWHLDHQLNFHRAFVAPHTCNAGSPRMTLLIDADGDDRFKQLPEAPDSWYGDSRTSPTKWCAGK